jgi:hypothetical protein
LRYNELAIIKDESRENRNKNKYTMGFLDDLMKSTNKMIDEMDSGSDNSRGQSFLEKFWDKKNELQDAKDSSYGDEKSSISKLLDLFNRKGKDNDMESW